MSKRPHHTRSRLPVILFSAEGLEYLGEGPEGVQFARLTEPVEMGAAAATQAAALARSLGAAPGPCIVALGASFLSQRVVSLPEVPAKELRVVLQRKAAALLEVEPEEALFSALPLDVEESAKEQKWLLLALRRSAYLRLRYALREAGFHVRRVVSERMALAAAAEVHVGQASGAACIAVGMEGTATGVHLLHGGQLVHQTVLSTRFEDDSAMAKVLVQELRGFDAFWRRRSRGGNVDRVVLVGIAPRWADRLEFAVHAALTSATIQRIECESESGARGARIASLNACRAESAVQVSLDLPLAPRRRMVVSAACASALLAAGVAFVSVDGLEERRARLEAERAQLETRAKDHDAVVRQERVIDDALDALGLHRERLARVGGYGLPFDRALTEALLVVGADGGLTSLSLTSSGSDAGKVELGIELPASPVESQRAVERILERAATARNLGAFTIETPRASAAAGATLRCRAEASLEVGS